MEASKTNQTRWEWHHNTSTPSLHLLPFCQLCTPQNSLHALSPPICIEWTSYSALLTPQHGRYGLSWLYAETVQCMNNAGSVWYVLEFKLCCEIFIAAECGRYGSSSLHTTNTKHICVSGDKMAQDVGMVWKCCSVIFQWFSSTPMSILSAIHHFVRITLFIPCMPPTGSSTEHVFTQVTKSFPSWKQAHIEMEASKTNQTRLEWFECYDHDK